MKFASFSIPGPRGFNQDAVLRPITLGQHCFFAVADGVGGSEGGGLVSEYSVAKAKEIVEQSPNISPTDLLNKIHREIETNPELQSGATTFSVVRLQGETAAVAHVGDSRVYHLRGNGLQTRTEDQTEIAELVREGVFTQNEAKRYKRKNILTSALSAKGQFNIYQNSFSVQNGDLIFVCTDGVYNVVNKRDLSAMWVSSKSLEEFAETLEDLIVERGAIDDSTAVIVCV